MNRPSFFLRRRGVQSALLAFCAVARLAAAPDANAAEPIITATRVVAHGDLDLSRVADQRTLNRRIVRAAAAACAEVSNGRAEHRWCVVTAKRNAALDMRRAALRAGAPQTALYQR